MPSHLTRQVFRRLVANEAIRYHGCLRQRCGPRQRLPVSNGASTHVTTQRRSFFNIFRETKKTVAEKDVDPGLEKLMELDKMTRLQARLPPVAEVEEAFRKFFAHKYRAYRKTAVEDEQMKYLLPALKYLRDEESQLLTMKYAVRLTKVLCRPPKHPSSDHIEFILTLYNTMETRYGRSLNSGFKRGSIRSLCSFKAVDEARDLLVRAFSDSTETASSEVVEEEVEEDEEPEDPRDNAECAAWRMVLAGYAASGNQTEAHHTLDLLKQRGFDTYDHRICRLMTEVYANANDIEAAKEWYAQWKTSTNGFDPAIGISEQPEATYGDLLRGNILRLCADKQDLTWGHEVIRDMIGGSPSKELWDLVFWWAAATGKGVDEIERMMGVMERSKEDADSHHENLSIDVETINSLVRFAISRNDPYMAERFIELGRRKDIEPNAKTLTLQMDYRLSVNDVDGALVSYQHLQSHDLSGDEDVPTVNNLVTALCQTGRHDFETIMNVTADLSDRQARLGAPTVSALSTLHLSRGELDDVVDLLNTHAYHYSTAERATVRSALVNFCISPTTEIAASWDAYTILRKTFDEMDRTERTQIMSNFFTLDRADMAVNIFTDMRRSTRSDAVATAETYITCLLGIAQSRDSEGLEVVYNQLKLDYSIEPATRLRNALMIAHTACDEHRRALGFWDEIAHSREGPNISSIHLAMRACERSPRGDEKAREIWNRLLKTGVELDQSLWASYIAGLVGSRNVENAIVELEEGVARGLVVVDSFLIGSVFNAALGQAAQAEVEDWAQQQFPHQWAELEETRIETDENGMRFFMIDRSVEP
ncbi:hypothetical protein MBLNU457_2264t1 [Dothideomycetes sp. NU457]